MLLDLRSLFEQPAVPVVDEGRVPVRRKYKPWAKPERREVELPAATLPVFVGTGYGELPTIYAEGAGRTTLRAAADLALPALFAAGAGTVTNAELRWATAELALPEIYGESVGRTRFRVSGEAELPGLSVRATARHDRSLRDQIEEEDDWLLEVA